MSDASPPPPAAASTAPTWSANGGADDSPRPAAFPEAPSPGAPGAWTLASLRLFWNVNEQRLRAPWRLASLAFVGTALSRITAASLDAAGVPPLGVDAPSRIILTLLLVLASVALVGHFGDRRTLGEFGLQLDRAWWADLGFGAALGALLMTGIFAAEWAAGWIRVTPGLAAGASPASLAAHLGPLALLFVGVAVNEELIFRGYLLRVLAEGLRGRRLGARAAVVYAALLTASLFGVAHLGNPAATWSSALGITVAGLLLAGGYILTGRLGAPIGLHLTWNFFQGPVYGFSVSGFQSHRTTVWTIEQGGPELWTGGAFGPEAGLVGLAATVLGCVLLLAWFRWRTGTLAVYTALSDPPLPRQPAA